VQGIVDRPAAPGSEIKEVDLKKKPLEKSVDNIIKEGVHILFLYADEYDPNVTQTKIHSKTIVSVNERFAIPINYHLTHYRVRHDPLGFMKRIPDNTTGEIHIERPAFENRSDEEAHVREAQRILSEGGTVSLFVKKPKHLIIDKASMHRATDEMNRFFNETEDRLAAMGFREVEFSLPTKDPYEYLNRHPEQALENIRLILRK
jgi:hypothetical protein